MKCLAAIAVGVLAAMSPVPAAAAQSAPAAGDAVFDAWDADLNGVLSRAEFEDGRRAMVQRNVAARLRAQFDKLDRNGDDSLDGAEYATLALVMQAGKDAPAMGAFDANGDKRLQFEEYVSSVRALVAAARQPGGTKP